jgi:hypothetical protein
MTIERLQAHYLLTELTGASSQVKGGVSLRRWMACCC